jgi:hypothetical protein
VTGIDLYFDRGWRRLKVEQMKPFFYVLWSLADTLNFYRKGRQERKGLPL